MKPMTASCAGLPPTCQSALGGACEICQIFLRVRFIRFWLPARIDGRCEGCHSTFEGYVDRIGVEQIDKNPWVDFHEKSATSTIDVDLRQIENR